MILRLLDTLYSSYWILFAKFVALCVSGVNCHGVHLVFGSDNNCNSTYLPLLVMLLFCSCKLIVLVFLHNLLGEHCRHW